MRVRLGEVIWETHGRFLSFEPVVGFVLHSLDLFSIPFHKHGF
jgi:hypothetical protein